MEIGATTKTTGAVEAVEATKVMMPIEGSGLYNKVRARPSGLTASTQYKVVLNNVEEKLLLELIYSIDKGDVNEVENILNKRKDDEILNNPVILSSFKQDKNNINNDYFLYFDRWIFNFDISIFQTTPYYKIKGTTLLHIASMGADINMIKLLIEKYFVDPRYFIRDNSSLPPAQYQNNAENVNSNIISNVGKNPLESALDMVQRMSLVVDYLNQRVTEKDSFGKNRGRSIRKTLTSPQTTNIISTFLQFAANGEVEEMKELLESDAVDINCSDYDKRTAFHLAASEGRLDVLKFLVEEYPKIAMESSNKVIECDLVAQDRWGHTSYDDAVRANKTECAEYLRENGGGNENCFHMIKDSTVEEFMILQARGISEKWAVESKEFIMDKNPFASGAGGQLFKVKFRGLTCVAKSCSGMSTNKSKLAIDLGNEISMMATLRHPHLVMFLGACFQMSLPILLMEFCEGGTLEEKILKSKSGDVYNLPKKTRLRYTQELATAMCFLHCCNPPIVHRDLKPSNVLLSGDNRIKVTDFGLSKFIPAKNKKFGDKFTMTGETGTYRYMAPEVFKHEEYNGNVDVYSFALVSYWVCSGIRPFSTISDPVEAVKKAALENRRPGKYPMRSFPCMAQLLERSWHHDSSLRPSFSEITKILESNEIQYEFTSFWILC